MVADDKGSSVRTGMAGSNGRTLIFTEHERAFCPMCFGGEEAQGPTASQGRVWAGVMVTVALQ